MKTQSMASGSTFESVGETLATLETTTIGDTAINDLFDAGNFCFNFAMFAGADTEYKEPKNYNDAWNNPDPMQKKKLCEAIQKEFKDMKTHEVWKKIKCSEIPQGRRCVKNC
jgi:hypothetical protein